MAIKGVQLTEQHKQNIRKALKNAHAKNPKCPTWLFSLDARRKASHTRIGHKHTPTGKKHFNWKGDNAGYGARHDWVRRHFGKPNKCENSKCKYPRTNWDGKLMEQPKRYEWANTSGEYKRRRDDWTMLCPSCHRTRDIKLGRNSKKSI